MRAMPTSGATCWIATYKELFEDLSTNGKSVITSSSSGPTQLKKYCTCIVLDPIVHFFSSFYSLGHLKTLTWRPWFYHTCVCMLSIIWPAIFEQSSKHKMCEKKQKLQCIKLQLYILKCKCVSYNVTRVHGVFMLSKTCNHFMYAPIPPLL